MQLYKRKDRFKRHYVLSFLPHWYESDLCLTKRNLCYNSVSEAPTVALVKIFWITIVRPRRVFPATTSQY